MLITPKILRQVNACEEGINFFDMFFPDGINHEEIFHVQGDYKDYIGFLKRIKWDALEFDSNDNIIRFEDINGVWHTQEFDSNNNLIRYENSNGYWRTQEFDSNDNIIRFETSIGYWYTQEFDSNDNMIRYEDSVDNMIRYEDSDGNWHTQEFDSNNNLIRYEKSTGDTITKFIKTNNEFSITVNDEVKLKFLKSNL